jgi:4-amino-4-deoxy-L-arabinose transferase-like glycosyltransferase
MTLSNWLYQIFPSQWNGLALRLPFILISSFTFIVWLKNLTFNTDGHEKSLFFFTVLYFLNPMLGLGGILGTPDIPLMLFWALSYYAILKIQKDQSLLWYACLGVTLGLGFCSKYHIVFLPFATLLSLIWLKQAKSIQLKKLLLTLTLGFIFCLPVLIWNYQNHWASFTFQLNHGLNAKKFDASWPVTYILGQILLFNPIIFYYLIRNVRFSLAKNIALTQWVFFIYSSFKALVEANWPLTSHAQALVTVNSSFEKYFKRSVLYWIFIYAALIGLYFTNFGQKKFHRLPQTVAAREIYQETKDYRPLYGPSYQMSSLMQFLSKEKIFKLQHLARHDLYDNLEGSIPLEKVFFVLKYSYADWPDWVQPLRKTQVKLFEKYDLELYQVSRE